MSHTLTPTPGYPLVAATVPDDGDDADAASVDVALAAHENSIATLAARLGGATSGLTTEWSYPSGKGRSTRVPALGGSVSTVYVPGGGSATSVDANAWRQHCLNASGAGPGGRDVITPTGKMFTGLPFHQYIRQLDKMVMPGGTMASVEVRVTKGSAQATSTDRMSIEFFKVSLTGTRTSIVTATANSSSGDETIFVATTEAIDLSTSMYYLSITSSLGAGSGTEDYFVGANLNWVDPGPRN